MGCSNACPFTEYNGNNIGRITPDGVITEFPIPTANSNPQLIASGSGNKVWFAESNVSNIGEIASLRGHLERCFSFHYYLEAIR